MEATPLQHGVVFIVDDDDAVRRTMQFLVHSVGLEAETFSSAEHFLKRFDADRAGCLVLDIRMPGLGGLELQDRLLELGSALPIIFITGHAEVPMAVEALQKGAFDFIQKPFHRQELLDRISDALAVDRRRRTSDAKRSEVLTRLETLTNREREVMQLVVDGKPNKVIAFDLGVSQRTVEIHRSRVMEKMKVRSVADLVRMSLYVNSENA